jgi:hypothetical protein
MQIDPTQAVLTTQISAVTEALKFQYGLITLLLAGIGFRFAKAWPTVSGTQPVEPSALVKSAAGCAGCALLVMLYEQHVLVRAISRRSIMEFTTHWLSSGEFLVDFLIVVAAILFALGWKE